MPITFAAQRNLNKAKTKRENITARLEAETQAEAGRSGMKVRARARTRARTPLRQTNISKIILNICS